ncbi:MAG: exodeoxyribonuclease V subunit gamma [Mycobacteriaceae bacterium]|nr:exodeoxyribonuclease V subunit gamma [Mycobacteriaceae bacterium]
MALHIHRAERTSVLAEGLGRLLAAPLPDPFAAELVLVPERGVERWLSQRLAHILGRGGAGDGVCAGVVFRSPRSLIAEILGITERDPWSPDAMVWPLLDVVDASLDEGWCRKLATHLGRYHCGDEAELRQGRRYAVARRIAGLFASYAAQRPALLADWSAGTATNGIGAELDNDLAWQPELWRALVERVDADPPHVRHQETVERLRESPSECPERLSLFGHTRLPLADIELLCALASHHDLHLWLPHPSDALWQALADHRGPVPRHDDDSHQSVGHPILATLGRDLRELQRSLPGDAAVDEYLGGTAHRETLLGWLQADINSNAVAPGPRRLAPDDRSIQVHSCHSPARQIEVLREVLLGLLADDPTLEPRDILVMCPDIETYAPLIVANFGLADVTPGAHPGHRLRVRLADRALAQTNPLLGVAAALLALAGGRATASQVLNLAQAAPVRARFGFTDDDLDAITAWVREAGIRWGFDQRHRGPYQLDRFVQNTWRFGLDRILAGVAMSDDSQAWVGTTTLPLDDVGSNRVELAGRLSEFVERLTAIIDSLDGVRPLCEWLDSLRDGVSLLARVGLGEEWQTGQLQREFADVLTDAGTLGQTPMRLTDVRALLDRHLAGRPTRANFRTGTLTVCTMVPMRSVPHRVVCLVGLDDGVFPRIGLVDGDDVLARNALTGERDIRSEDRQLLLDAILAATDKLVITYTGADERTGQPRPPAVPLVELLDALDATTAEPVGDRIVVCQPLQPFDVRNVAPGALGVPTPFTFDQTALVAAQAAAGQRIARPPFIDQPLAEPPGGDVALAELSAFFRDPVKGFFRALQFTLPADIDGVEDTMPVEIDALQTWTAGDRMLGDMLRGKDRDWALGAEWRRGSLPPGQLGWRTAKGIRDQAAEIACAAHVYRQGDAEAFDVDIDLGCGRRLSGTVADVFSDRIVSVTYSKLDGKHLLECWIPLLALVAGHPGRYYTAVCIGRSRRGTRATTRMLAPPDEDAVGVLRELVTLYDAGRREPLPLPVKTSFAWAAARHTGDDPLRAAAFRWKSTPRYPGEDEAPAHCKAWGDHAWNDALMRPPRAGEEVPGETTRLGAFATRLWLPMLRAERKPD